MLCRDRRSDSLVLLSSITGGFELLLDVSALATFSGRATGSLGGRQVTGYVSQVGDWLGPRAFGVGSERTDISQAKRGIRKS